MGDGNFKSAKAIYHLIHLAMDSLKIFVSVTQCHDHLFTVG